MGVEKTQINEVSEISDITTDSTDIKKVKRGYSEILCGDDSENVDENPRTTDGNGNSAIKPRVGRYPLDTSRCECTRAHELQPQRPTGK